MAGGVLHVAVQSLAVPAIDIAKRGVADTDGILQHSCKHGLKVAGTRDLSTLPTMKKRRSTVRSNVRRTALTAHPPHSDSGTMVTVFRINENVYTRPGAMSTENVEMRPAQCRAGRALLEMTQPQLAKLAGLGLSTVVDFEKERRQVSAAAVEMIRRALRRAGIEFIDENGGGPGVRLRKRQYQKE
jgi:DNA-binding transcriptional regulator YiaG